MSDNLLSCATDARAALFKKRIIALNASSLLVLVLIQQGLGLGLDSLDYSTDIWSQFNINCYKSAFSLLPVLIYWLLSLDWLDMHG